MSSEHTSTWAAPRDAIAGFLVAVLFTSLAACGSSDEAGTRTTGPDDRDLPTVLVTTTILADVARNVTGDTAVVESILPPGTDPHSFEPSAAQVARLHDADLVIAFGLGLEAGLSGVLESVEAGGTPVLEVSPQVGPIPFGSTSSEHGHDDDHDDDDHGAGDMDPHVWTDPDRMASAAKLIADALTEHTDADPGVLEANVAAYDAELRLLDEEIQATLSAIPDERRVLVTNHDSLGYFAERYGFEVVGTVIPGGSTLAEPSAAAIGKLVEVVREHDLPAAFTEVGVDASVARSLADEVGGSLTLVGLHTDALGGTGSGAETYIAMMTTNSQLIAGALAP